jgi:adenylate cyclase
VTVRLSDHLACFQGVVPSTIATCDTEGTPNVTDLSQVRYVDETHVALSCQFFNKTRRNVERNPYATVEVLDPVTFEALRLELRFDHSETEGPLFDAMALRVQVIASHAGMSGVFRLLSADVYEVLGMERVENFLLLAERNPVTVPAAPTGGPLAELKGLQAVSDRIGRACDLDGLLAGALETLDQVLGFSHAMVLLREDPGERLVAIAHRGYGSHGVGAEVAIGEGIIGTVAARHRMVRMLGVGAELRYGRTIRERMEACGDRARLAPEVPLPGLPDAQAQLALPLLAGNRLVGVLAVESRDPMQFDEWDEAFLGIVANQIAQGIARMQAGEEEVAPPAPAAEEARALPAGPMRRFTFYRNDDCVFLDGEYLIRNVPGKILWKVLDAHRREGRVEFANRELRLDPWLGLPSVKDNLESRLILLRRRLEARCPDVRLVPVRRGHFALRLACRLELVERACG